MSRPFKDAKRDVFDRRELDGIMVYVEREANGDEWVWLMLHLKGRKEPVGIPLDPGSTIALMQQMQGGLKELAKTPLGAPPRPTQH